MSQFKFCAACVICESPAPADSAIPFTLLPVCRAIWHEVSRAREQALSDEASSEVAAGANWLQMHLEIRCVYVLSYMPRCSVLESCSGCILHLFTLHVFLLVARTETSIFSRPSKRLMPCSSWKASRGATRAHCHSGRPITASSKGIYLTWH